VPIDCRVVDRALVIRDSTGRALWEGRVDGLDALEAAPLGETCAVVLDWSQALDRRFLNLVCVAQNGAVLWHAEMPTNRREEAYTKISVQGDALVAWSFFGLMVYLDPETGRIRSKQFVG
jgi:hypothetical protein